MQTLNFQNSALLSHDVGRVFELPIDRSPEVLIPRETEHDVTETGESLGYGVRQQRRLRLG